MKWSFPRSILANSITHYTKMKGYYRGPRINLPGKASVGFPIFETTSPETIVASYPSIRCTILLPPDGRSYKTSGALIFSLEKLMTFISAFFPTFKMPLSPKPMAFALSDVQRFIASEMLNLAPRDRSRAQCVSM